MTMNVARPAGLLALVLVVVFYAASARAEVAGRTAVVVVEGGASDDVSSRIASHIVSPHRVTDSAPFLAALASRGTHSLASAIGNRAADAQLIARARSVANDTHVDVVILVGHKKTRRGLRGHLWVIDAHAEGIVADEDVATGNDEAAAAWNSAGDLFPAAAPEPSPPPEAKAQHEPRGPAIAAGGGSTADRAQEAPSSRSSEGPTHMSAMFIAQLDAAGGSRHFSYVDRVTGTLRPYDLFAAPIASIAIEAYPFAHMGSRALAGIGVAGDYSRAFGIASSDTAGTRVGTEWQGYDIGLRYRIGLGEAFLLGVNLGYGAIDFDFDKTSLPAVLPSTGYRFLRGALDLRGTHGAIAIFGGGGYLDVLSTGDIGSQFPRETVGGMEAHLGAAYTIAAGFELSLEISYTRFFYSMNPQPGDSNVAGGALDEMARASLGVTWLL